MRTWALVLRHSPRLLPPPVGMGVFFLLCKWLRAYVCDSFFLRKSAEILVVDTLMYIGRLWRPFFVRAVRPCFCYSRKMLLCEMVKGAKGRCEPLQSMRTFALFFRLFFSSGNAMFGLYAVCWSQSPEADVRSSGVAKNKPNRPVFGCVECC